MTNITSAIFDIPERKNRVSSAAVHHRCEPPERLFQNNPPHQPQTQILMRDHERAWEGRRQHTRLKIECESCICASDSQKG